MRELLALIDGLEVARIEWSRRDKLTLRYSPAWREDPGAYPISLSMPLAAEHHPDEVVRPFLWGLLPDNERVLGDWGRQFGVSPRNPFALLQNVGEDCAGAVQFLTPDRLDQVSRGLADGIQWLTETEVAERLRLLAKDHTGARRIGEGQFSLAGAQPKTALIRRNGRWGIPSGRVPTTHILKPPTGAYEGFAENEHFCLELAAALGLPTVRSRVMQFDGRAAIVVERYDRSLEGDNLRRIHQEDFCQVLGIQPQGKYEREGGPGIPLVVQTLWEHSNDPQRDVGVFLDSVVLNWVIGGTDGHAKNYSVLIAPGEVRLAPLYDLVSALPYPALEGHRIRLAMRVGGEYLIRRIGKRQWARLADELRRNPGEIVERVHALTTRVPQLAGKVRADAEAAGLIHPMLGVLEAQVVARARECIAQLGSP